MKNKIWPLAIILILLTGATVLAASWKLSRQQTSDNKISVATTLFPLYDMAQKIGGDKIEVSLLLPPGLEPHDFEPKPSDIITINEADIFVYTGKFMEPWAADIISGLSNNNVTIVDSSQGVTLPTSDFHGEGEPIGSSDPHIWLDFGKAKIMAENIAQAIVSRDPANSQYYQNNLNNYWEQLDLLDQNYRQTLSNCQNQEIVYAGHYAFGYLAKRYDLAYLAAQGLSPDAEPTANALKKLVDQIKANNLRYIFYEELTSPKIAQTLSAETDASLLLLNAAHNITKDQLAVGRSFFDIMKENLDNLKIGLNCQQP